MSDGQTYLVSKLPLDTLRLAGYTITSMDYQYGINPTNEVNMSIAQITRQARKSQGLTLQKFGEALSENLSSYSFTKQAVFNWESGKQRPDFQFLVLCAMKYGDWRRDWALNCLAILKPEVFAPAD